MADLSKIDELIRKRAYAEAKDETEKAIKALPYWSDDFTIWSDCVKGEVTIERWRLLQGLQEAIKQELVKVKIEHYSKKILETVDDLNWLRESVENLERNQPS